MVLDRKLDLAHGNNSVLLQLAGGTSTPPPANHGYSRPILIHTTTSSNTIVQPLCKSFIQDGNDTTLVSGECANTTIFPGNDSDYGDNFMSMEEAFGNRLIVYTILSSTCIIFNILSLLAMARIRSHHSVHHVLLVNLAVCDIVGSALLWMYYNSPVLFPRFKIETLVHCLFITVVLVAPFILSLCNSLCSLLMLALNQYIAICDPIFSATKMTKRKVRGGIAIAWLISAFLASIPALTMLFRTQYEQCYGYAQAMAQKSLEIVAYALAFLIVIIVALYARIYRVVVVYRRQGPHIRRNRTTNGTLEAETNYKACVTTLLLTGNLLFFWLPFMAFNFISAHIDIDTVPVSLIYAKLYVVDFLPVLNFLTDPIIYGIRMREIRLGYHRLCAKILPCCIKEPRRPTFSRTTIRFSTLETDSTVLWNQRSPTRGTCRPSFGGRFSPIGSTDGLNHTIIGNSKFKNSVGSLNDSTVL
jgi:hypothetical protein